MELVFSWLGTRKNLVHLPNPSQEFGAPPNPCQEFGAPPPQTWVKNMVHPPLNPSQNSVQPTPKPSQYSVTPPLKPSQNLTPLDFYTCKKKSVKDHSLEMCLGYDTSLFGGGSYDLVPPAYFQSTVPKTFPKIWLIIMAYMCIRHINKIWKYIK